MGTIFIAGSYGVGKSTLCEKLSHKVGIPFYSAGDIISRVNGEAYGANKAVSDKSGNQEILSEEINKILKIHPNILLAGHFCIFNKSNQVEHLSTEVFLSCILKISCCWRLTLNASLAIWVCAMEKYIRLVKYGN